MINEARGVLRHSGHSAISLVLAIKRKLDLWSLRLRFEVASGAEESALPEVQRTHRQAGWRLHGLRPGAMA